MIVTSVKVLNELGLHARPIARLVRMATGYSGSIYFEKDGKQYNANSLTEVLMMNAKKDEDLRLEVDGVDEEDMLKIITQMFLNKFGERE